MLADPIVADAAGDVHYPVLIVEIPLYSFADAVFKGFRRVPADGRHDVILRAQNERQISV